MLAKVQQHPRKGSRVLTQFAKGCEILGKKGNEIGVFATRMFVAYCCLLLFYSQKNLLKEMD